MVLRMQYKEASLDSVLEHQHLVESSLTPMPKPTWICIKTYVSPPNPGA